MNDGFNTLVSAFSGIVVALISVFGTIIVAFIQKDKWKFPTALWIAIVGLIGTIGCCGGAVLGASFFGGASPSSSAQPAISAPVIQDSIPTSTNSSVTVPTSAPAITQVTKTVAVDVSSPTWVETGIYIHANQILEIQASGKVTTWEGNSVGDSYPDGNDWVCDEAGCILSGAKYGALVGKIGNTPVFLIGSNYQGTVSNSGYLYLRMNDVSSSYLDNSGSYTVTIQTK